MAPHDWNQPYWSISENIPVLLLLEWVKGQNTRGVAGCIPIFDSFDPTGETREILIHATEVCSPGALIVGVDVILRW